MAEDDRSVKSAGDDPVAHGIGVAVSPVHRVDRPDDRGRIEQRKDAGVAIAIGRTDKICKAAAKDVVQNILCMVDLPAHFVVRQGRELRVVIAVLRDLMSLAEDPAGRLVVALGTHSKLEKGRMDITLRKTVEQALGIGSGAVVKGQRDQLLLPVLRRNRHRQERQQAADRQKQGGPFLQYLHILFLHLLFF